MKKWTLVLTALAAALVNGLAAEANDGCGNSCCQPACCDSCCNSCCEGCCDSCCDSCCGGYTIGFDFEATFLRFHQSGGVQQGGGTAEYDFDFAPRFVVEVEGCDGFGARARYWDYDADATFTNTLIQDIDTYTLDFELFQTFAVNCTTTIEVFGGIRFNEFDQTIVNAAGVTQLATDFSGYGGTIGIEGRKAIGPGSAYARGRWSIVMGDYGVPVGVAPALAHIPDHTMLQTELGLGYELSYSVANGALLKFNAGVEFQQWEDAVLVGSAFGVAGNTNLVNAGWGGFVFGAGLEF